MESLTTASELLNQGKLDDALQALQSDVRDDPANSANRIFLFQLLCVKGEWDRALTQLNTAAEINPEALLMSQAYREVLQCEVFRREVFTNKRAPLVFGEPPKWIGLMLQSLSCSSNGEGAKAKELIADALDGVKPRSGKIDGQEFEWIADADMRLGPVLEAIINGKYYWVPFDSIASIEFSEPTDLRDLVWLPATFNWTNEGSTMGFVPSRYSGTEDSGDELAALGRKTEWLDIGDEFYQGVGQKMLATEEDEYSLLAIRRLEFCDSRST